MFRKPPPVRHKSATLSLEGIHAEVAFSQRRRTLSIKIQDGCVRVRAPHYVALAEVKRFVQSKTPWIKEKLLHQQAQLRDRERRWCSGETLPLLGETLHLEIEQGARGKIHRRGDLLVVVAPELENEGRAARVQALVQRWYKQQAMTDFARRLEHWQEVTGLRASALKVRAYKARWGTCSQHREITLNWKLLMAPPEVVDYVVVHELCHIAHFNHSPEYWALVSRYQPHYKTHKEWLKAHGLRLEL